MKSCPSHQLNILILVRKLVRKRKHLQKIVVGFHVKPKVAYAGICGIYVRTRENVTKYLF